MENNPIKTRPIDPSGARSEAVRKVLEKPAILAKAKDFGLLGMPGLDDVLVLAAQNPEYVIQIMRTFKRAAAANELRIPVNIIGEPLHPLTSTQARLLDVQQESFEAHFNTTMTNRAILAGLKVQTNQPK